MVKNKISLSLCGAVLGLLSIAACDEPRALPFVEAGNIKVTIVERQVGDPVAVHEGSAVGIYRLGDPLNPESIELTRSFKGSLAVPVAVKKEDRVLVLSILKVRDSKGSVLGELQGDPLRALRLSAKIHSSVEILMDRDGQVAPELKAFSDPRSFFEFAAPQNFTSIKTVFPDPMDVIRLEESDLVLEKLRYVASATEHWHQALLTLLEKTPSIDSIRLALVLDACLFDSRSTEAMKQRLDELNQANDPATEALRKTLSENLAQAKTYAPFSRTLLLKGLGKIQRLTFDAGAMLLTRVFSTFGSSAESAEIFELVLSRMGNDLNFLTAKQKLAVMDLAVQKQAFDFAARVAVSWFSNNSDKTLKELLDLTSKIPSKPHRDTVLLSVTEVPGARSFDEVKQILGMIYADEVAQKLFESLVSALPELTSVQSLELVSPRPVSEFRDRLLLLAMQKVKKITAAEIGGVLQELYAGVSRKQAAALLMPLVSALSGEGILEALKAFDVRSSDRDEIVLLALPLLTAMGAQDLAALLTLTMSEQTEAKLFDAGLEKISKISVSAAINVVAALQSTGLRDRMLVFAATQAEDLGVENLKELLEKASSEEVRGTIREKARERSIGMP